MSELARITGCSLLAMAALAAGGCGTVMSLASERVASDLRQAVLDHDDPATVRDGAPAWLLMTDALAAGAPGNPRLQAQAALLYSAYAGGFVPDDAQRARRLAARARRYGRDALCAQQRTGCGLLSRPFEAFEADIDRFNQDDVAILYATAVAELAYIQAHAEDWGALADLPRVEVLLSRVVALDDDHDDGTAHAYLGVLKSLRPPALGGDPEDGRRHFERAISLSGGHNLMIKVLYAEHYARLTYDRALHDRLLDEVLGSGVHYPGYTLGNVLAQRRAAELLARSPDYFFDLEE